MRLLLVLLALAPLPICNSFAQTPAYDPAAAGASAPGSECAQSAATTALGADNAQTAAASAPGSEPGQPVAAASAAAHPAAAHPAAAQPAATQPAAAQPAATQAVEQQYTLRCTADTTLNAAQADGRLETHGGRKELVVSALNYFILLRFDLAPVRHMQITSATLRLKRRAQQVVRVGVSTVAAGKWAEGKEDEQTLVDEHGHPRSPHVIRPQEGAANFRFAAHHDEERKAGWWAAPGSDFSDVVFGNGGSRWAACVPAFDRANEVYEIAIPPELVQAMVDGHQTDSLALSDDFHRPEVFSTFASHESDAPPELIVKARSIRAAETAAPTDLRAFRDDMGLEWLSFRAPGALGFEVYLADREIHDPRDLTNVTRLEAWSLPTPSDGELRALLSLYRASPDKYVIVRAAAPSGDWSPLVSTPLPPRVTATPELNAPKLPRFSLPRELTGPLVLDDGPAISRDGFWIRSDETTWWDPVKGPVTLESGRSEFIAFQVVLAGQSGAHAVTLADWKAPAGAKPESGAPQAAYFRQNFVEARVGRDKFAPDPLTPLRASEVLQLEFDPPPPPAAAGMPASAPAPGARRFAQAIYVEIFVPRSATPGTWTTRVIVLRDGVALLDLPLTLEVLPATLPDTLAFKVSLSGRDLAAITEADDDESRWRIFERLQRIAHAHRATLALIPYASDGRVKPGFAPEIEVGPGGEPAFKWDAWDARFGPHLSGAAFKGQPRDGAPLDHLVLPFFENWPVSFAFERAAGRSSLAGKYHHQTTYLQPRPGMRANPQPDAYMRWPVEEAFSDEYESHTIALLERFAQHLAERGWTIPQYHLTLVNNSSPRERGSWWHLGEPEVLDDYLAAGFWNRLYGSIKPAAGVQLARRGMLRDPQLARHELNGLVDIAVLDDDLLNKSRLILSDPRFPRTLWFNGGEVSPELGPAGLWKWCWSARLAGARGYLLRSVIGDKKAWEKADDSAFFYPPRERDDLPAVSLRLKALRRVQQDLDWLQLWIERNKAAGIPEGFSLGQAGTVFMQNAGAKLPAGVALLPVLTFPGRLDTVAFEEMRRALRADAAKRGP